MSRGREDTPSDSRFERGRGWWSRQGCNEPLLLTFRAREGLVREDTPSGSRFERGRVWGRSGSGQGCNEPLRLAFRAREGLVVVVVVVV